MRNGSRAVITRARGAFLHSPVKAGVTGGARFRSGLAASMELLWSVDADPLPSTEGVAAGDRIRSGLPEPMEPFWSTVVSVRPRSPQRWLERGGSDGAVVERRDCRLGALAQLGEE